MCIEECRRVGCDAVWLLFLVSHQFESVFRELGLDFSKICCGITEEYLISAKNLVRINYQSVL
jgi:hypothetical protein